MAGITPIANTPIGALSAIETVPGGFGASVQGGLICSQGTVTVNGTSPQTVANANVTANSQIIITLKTVGGTVGALPAISTITPGTGFTVVATAADTSTYNYLILG